MRRSLRNRFLGIHRDESKSDELPRVDKLSLELSSSSVTSNVSLSEQLWNRAYDALKKDEPRLISAYQTLLGIENVIMTREQILETINKGLDKTESQAAKKKSVAAAVEVANQIKDTVAAGLKPSAEATLVWTALTAALPLILNASEQSEKNRKGMEMVLLVLRQHDLLLSNNHTLFNPGAEDLRQEHIVKLYQKLLCFLIGSACYYQRNRLGIILRDSVKLDDWDKQIEDIKDAQASLRSFLKDMTPLNKEDKDCLAKLHLTTPSLDKVRIEKRAGSLFRDCYQWILQHKAYQMWRDEDEKLLWIKGDPGKGKTMLICGIIDELVNTPLVSYFFCQATYDKTNNNATAILRGLIWMLAEQNPHLIYHIRNEADRSSDAIYNNTNSFYTLSKIFHSILCDLDGIILIVDALDECVDGRNDFIDLVKDTSNTYHIKWLISSRNWPSIEERLGDVAKLSLEIENSIEFAVQSYVTLKVSQLSSQKGYSQELTVFITEYLSAHAGGTFLWVALVCTNLQNAGKREVKRLIKELPPTLDSLYERMLQNVITDHDALTLTRILATATSVFRPVSILELGNIMELSDDDLESINELIQECGSFLTIRDDIIEFVHLSAQEYIKTHLPLAVEAKSTHREIYCHSLRTLSRTLKRNIYELNDACIAISDIVSPGNNPLVPVEYCCSYWARHLEKSDAIVSELSDDSSLALFLERDFLFWLEAMSLLEAVPRAVDAMHILYSITKDAGICQLRDFISDARSFVLFFRITLDLYPLQIYDSGLVFSPVSSLVRKAYVQMAPAWVTMPINPLPDWPISTAFAVDFGMDDENNDDIQDTLCTPVYIASNERIALGTVDGRLLTYSLTNGSLQSTLDLTRFSNIYTSSSLRIRELSYCESSSCLLFTLSKQSETKREVEKEAERSKIPSVLGRWNLESSQMDVLKDFPSNCKLSPCGRYVAFEEEHNNKWLLRYYDVRRDEVFSLPSINGTVLYYTFAVDSAIVAIWWQSGSIEILDIKKRSRLGIIENQQPPLGKRCMALSQHGEILAISSYRVTWSSHENEVKVFDTKTGQLLWSKSGKLRIGFEIWRTCNFLKDTNLMAVNCCDSIRLYNTREGTIVGKVEITYSSEAQPLQCKQQLALVSRDNVELLDISMAMLDPLDSLIWHFTDVFQHKMLRVRVLDVIKDVYWLEVWNPDTRKITWKSPAVPAQSGYTSYVRLNDDYVVDKQRDMVVISQFDGTSLQEHSKLNIAEEAKMSCAPNGFYIAFWQQDFTSIYDVRQQIMITDSTAPRRVPGYRPCMFPVEAELEIPKDELEKMAPAIWTRESERMFRQIDRGLLIWSIEKGFQKIMIEIQGVVELSPCGTWLACLMADIDNTAPSSRNHNHTIQIWHIGSRKLKSVLYLESRHRLWSSINCQPNIMFLPDKEQALIMGERLELWSFSEYSGEKLLCVTDAYWNHSRAMRFTSLGDLETERGVVSLAHGHNEVKFGTTSDPLLNRKWIYLDGCKALRIPRAYSIRNRCTYSEGQLALNTNWSKLVVLRFSLNQISEAEREVFYRTHQKANMISSRETDDVEVKDL